MIPGTSKFTPSPKKQNKTNTTPANPVLLLEPTLVFDTRKFTRRASKRRRVLFAVVWSQTAQRGVVRYHIKYSVRKSDPLTRRPVDPSTR